MGLSRVFSGLIRALTFTLNFIEKTSSMERRDKELNADYARLGLVSFPVVLLLFALFAKLIVHALPWKRSRQHFRLWYPHALNKIVSRRVGQESRVSPGKYREGDRVFCSQYFYRGHLRHWALHASGHEYKLSEEIDKNGEKVYKVHISVSDVTSEVSMELMKINHSPEVGRYFNSTIGWTKFTKKEIDECCHQIQAKCTKYALLCNNNHEFLKALAGKIIEKGAFNWKSYKANRFFKYKDPEGERLGDHVLLAAIWSSQLQKHINSYDKARKAEAEAFWSTSWIEILNRPYSQFNRQEAVDFLLETEQFVSTEMDRCIASNAESKGGGEYGDVVEVNYKRGKGNYKQDKWGWRREREGERSDDIC